MSLRFRVIFSSACALLVALLCAAYASHVRAEAERVRQESIERYGGEVVRLVVAADGLAAGDVVGYGNVVERDWLVDLAPEGAITSMDDALGARVSVPVAAGAPITELNLREDSALPEVPAGMVAVTLPLTDKLGLSKGVSSGTQLVAFEVNADGARLISSEVQVVVAPVEATGLATSAVVTVAAPPGDVESLLSANASGSLRLAVPANDVRVDARDVDAAAADGAYGDVSNVPVEDVTPAEEAPVAEEAPEEVVPQDEAVAEEAEQPQEEVSDGSEEVDE